METRLTSQKDAPLLASLHAEAFADGCWSPDQIAGSLALPSSFAFIAEENGQSCGFILCQISGDDAEILTFCTAPAYRRRGIGKKLLATALAAARQKKAHRIFLEVASDNQAAQTLYRKSGFRISGRRKDYYKRAGHAVDAVMLALDL